eukprot:1496083-Prymnesium_polylepis.1
MIHRHPKHPRTAVPNVCATCNGCRYDFPFAAQRTTFIGDDNWLRYRRRPWDMMIVPYNPW